jgi:hypothetical protein
MGLKYMKKKTPAQEWVEQIKTDPKKLIEWAKREIREYQRLIKILESKKK